MRSLLKLSTSITYSPQTTTNKKPALGGLEKAQALRSFLTPTSDSSPAMMPRSQIGLVGTGVATVGTGAGASPPNPDATSAVTLPVGPVPGVKVRFGLSQPVAP